MSRLQAAAMADLLIYRHPTTFDPFVAAGLLALLPRPTWRQRLRMLLPGFQFKASVPGLGTSGVAAGVGTIRMDGGTHQVDFDLQGRPCLRAGQWRIYRETTRILGQPRIIIEQVMQTEPDGEQTAIVVFRNGRPVEMQRLHPHTLNLGPLTLTAARRRTWKLPA